MRSFWVALAVCVVFGLLWLGVPPISADVDTSIYFLDHSWRAQRYALHIWEPLPQKVVFKLVAGEEPRIDPPWSWFEVPVQTTTDSLRREADIRRSWLRITAWQFALLAWLLLRHRPLARNGRRLASWLKRHASPAVIVAALIFGSITVIVVLTLIGPQFSSWASRTITAGIDSPVDDPAAYLMRHIESLIENARLTMWVLPHYGFTVLSWSSLGASAVLLFISCMPVPRSR